MKKILKILAICAIAFAMIGITIFVGSSDHRATDVRSIDNNTNKSTIVKLERPPFLDEIGNDTP